nr:uncharacterized protein LOC105338284 isoform X2 [Crassostrea gigas]
MLKTLRVLIFLCSTFTVSATLIPRTATKCFTDAECGQDECCFRHEGPWIVSKRQDGSLTGIHFGVCEKYQGLGDLCNSIDKMNGHCGCGPGLTCSAIIHHTTDTPTFQKRTFVPGQCQPNIPNVYPS